MSMEPEDTRGKRSGWSLGLLSGGGSAGVAAPGSIATLPKAPNTEELPLAASVVATPIRKVERGHKPLTPDTVLGVGSRICGSLGFAGTVQIEGEVEGDIACEGELTIGEQAVIHGLIQASSARIFGKVVGDITCRDRLELHAGASVHGDLLCPKVVMQDGVFFDGTCRMKVGESGAS